MAGKAEPIQFDPCHPGPIYILPPPHSPSLYFYHYHHHHSLSLYLVSSPLCFSLRKLLLCFRCFFPTPRHFSPPALSRTPKAPTFTLSLPPPPVVGFGGYLPPAFPCFLGGLRSSSHGSSRSSTRSWDRGAGVPCAIAVAESRRQIFARDSGEGARDELRAARPAAAVAAGELPQPQLGQLHGRVRGGAPRPDGLLPGRVQLHGAAAWDLAAPALRELAPQAQPLHDGPAVPPPTPPLPGRRRRARPADAREPDAHGLPGPVPRRPGLRRARREALRLRRPRQLRRAIRPPGRRPGRRIEGDGARERPGRVVGVRSGVGRGRDGAQGGLRRQCAEAEGRRREGERQGQLHVHLRQGSPRQGRFGVEALQIHGEQRWRGQLCQGESGAEQQRERRQEAGQGRHIEARPRPAPGLHPCPGEARGGDGQPQPRREGEKREDQPEDEAAAGSCAGLQQGGRQGGHARRDHKLRAIVATASRVSVHEAGHRESPAGLQQFAQPAR